MNSMKPNNWKHFVALAALGAFAGNSPSFDTKWHADATRVGMQQNGFSSDARLLAQFSNYLTDFFSVVGFEAIYERLPGGAPAGAPSGLHGINMADMARLHFDALTTEAQIEHQWKTLEENTKKALEKWSADGSLKPAYKPIVLISILGASLHAIQDFYSHSNWIKVAKRADGSIPLWFDVPAESRAKLLVKCGWYPDGNDPNTLYHDQENKDSTGRPLNAEAYEAASRASADWVKRLMDATPSVPWATLKAWKPEPEQVAGPWLRKADATFITSTSAIAGHWDGATPAKNVFDADPARNKAMAIQALTLSLGVYSQNIALSSGDTPTPNWVVFTIAHVERDLAKDLYLQNKKR